MVKTTKKKDVFFLCQEDEMFTGSYSSEKEAMEDASNYFDDEDGPIYICKAVKVVAQQNREFTWEDA